MVKYGPAPAIKVQHHCRSNNVLFLGIGIGQQNHLDILREHHMNDW